MYVLSDVNDFLHFWATLAYTVQVPASATNVQALRMHTQIPVFANICSEHDQVWYFLKKHVYIKCRIFEHFKLR